MPIEEEDKKKREEFQDILAPPETPFTEPLPKDEPPKTTLKTPEERLKEGRKLIQTREKRKKALMDEGLTEKQASQQFSREVEAGDFREAGIVGAGEEAQAGELRGIAEREVEATAELVANLQTSGEVLDRTDRLARAGLLTIADAANLASQAAIGKDVAITDLEGLKKPSIAKGLLTAVGGITTTDISGFSIAGLFGYKEEVQALENDIKANRETGEATLRAVRDGGNVYAAIDKMQEVEDAARFKYANVMRILAEDPDSVADGVTAADDALRNINRIVADRAILERYAVTGDTDILNRRSLEFEEQ